MLDHIRRKWIYKPLNILVSFIFYTSNSLMSLMISLKRIPVPTVATHSKSSDMHFYFLWDLFKQILLKYKFSPFVQESLVVTNWKYFPQYSLHKLQD